MKFVAIQKNTRQSPRKVRLVANQVKNLPLAQALDQLGVIQKKSTLVILKTMKQAIANAMNNHGVAFDQLQLDTIMVTEGSRYRRFQAVSRGRAHSILKRTCHVRVELSTKTAPEVKKADAKPAVKGEATKEAAKTGTQKTETKKVVKTAPKKTAAPAAPRQVGRSAKAAQPVNPDRSGSRVARKAVVRNKAGKK